MKIKHFVFASLLALVTSVPLKDDGSGINVESEKLPEGLTWEQWHMQHEHQLDDYDPETFFTLHDVGKKGYLDRNDILSLYGLNRDEIVGAGDGMGKHDNSEVVDEEHADRVVKFIMRLLDVDDDTKIAKKEYLDYAKSGKSFPDLGVGVGHHADFEKEYEIHHWNKYHKDSDPEVKNVHKEDIEHELLHHEHEIEHEEKIQRGASRSTVVTDDELESRIDRKNIPSKYKNGF
ncbi:LAFE_0F09538g1_1 [Lachancea fermentati]|uniref:LAFE_0F09538g1_1 n=1 Tax=Lachancea fermentati TaxID=4955 RepID=A0A1G4MF73_LACFM|nr:LAFE_0F09538g1_1 [Lachancea fermentati]